MSKRATKRHRKAVGYRYTYGVPGLSKTIIETFQALADEQRGEPEQAMTAAQFAIGGGVLPFCLEHVGDLIHRMSQHLQWDSDAGREYIVNKCEKTLRVLRNEYGFEREHRENLASNARFFEREYNVPPAEYAAKVAAALKRYAAAHAALPVYNRPQFLAQQASIALGEGRYKDAEDALARLLAIAEGGEWVAAATACKLDATGKPVAMGKGEHGRYERLSL